MTDYQNDEIDLRPYIQALIRKWWVWMVIALTGAVLGLIISRLPAETYETTAIILLTKQTNKLSLTSQLPTISEPTDVRARAEAILTLVESDSVAWQVMTSLQDQLPANITLETFKKWVNFEAAGDTILIKAVSQDAVLAEAIANTWSQMMVETVNMAYSGEQPLSIVQTQRQASKVDYAEAQAALEAFLETSQIEALQQQLDELSILSNGQTNDRLSLYEYYRTRKNEMLAIQIQGGALKAQLQQGNQSAAGDMGDALAVFLARANALNLTTNIQNSAGTSSAPQYNSPTYQQEFTSFTRFTDPSLTFQFNEMDVLLDTSQNYLADIEVIIELAKAEQADAENALAALSQIILSDESSTTLSEAFTKIRQVKAQLEREQALYKRLTNARDLAWSAYQALSAKETEIKNAPKASNYVVLITPAMRPLEPMPRGTLRNTMFGGAVGFFLSVMFILARVWWLSANIMSDMPGTSQKTMTEKQA